MAVDRYRGRTLLAGLAFLGGGMAAGFGNLSSAVAGPAVVELFTSQGCSSCPPADANLGRLVDRDDVLALSFGVTYWDYLGWQDTFARREFSARQHAYARAFGAANVFTPQMVVNGREVLIGHDLDEIEAAITTLGPANVTAVTVTADKAIVDAATTPPVTADIWLVRYEPGTIDVPVARGENGGRTLPIAHAVRELTRIGTWSGGALELTLPAGDPTLKRAILIQDPKSGAILAAASG